MKTEIFIIVKGGVVENIFSNDENLKPIVVDIDDEAEDEFNIQEYEVLKVNKMENDIFIEIDEAKSRGEI